MATDAMPATPAETVVRHIHSKARPPKATTGERLKGAAPGNPIPAVGNYAASNQARKILVVSMILVAALGTINALNADPKTNPKPGLPHIQFWIRTGILFFMLALLVEFRPKFGGSLAAMVALGAVIQNGVGAINYFNSLGVTSRKFDEQALANANVKAPARAGQKPGQARQARRQNRRNISRQNAAKLSHLKP